MTRAKEYDTRDISVGIQYLGMLYRQRRFELTRLYRLFHNMSSSYELPLQKEFANGLVDKYSIYKNYQWDDASKIASYFDYVTRKITKYGLHMSFIQPNKFENYKQKIKEEEDALTEYFLYEMRKKPVEQNYEPMKL